MTKKDCQVCFSAGEILFTEGDEGDEAYILDKGSISLSKKGHLRVVVAEIIRDGMFGMMPLIDGLPRQYTATARKNSVCTVVSKEKFAKALSSQDPMIRAAIYYLTKSLREATTRLTNGGVLNVEEGDMK
ncbi:MAG: Crp/Fnr family transcriptional regulator [Alphaproteobacteria bacterium]